MESEWSPTAFQNQTKPDKNSHQTLMFFWMVSSCFSKVLGKGWDLEFVGKCYTFVGSGLVANDHLFWSMLSRAGFASAKVLI